ncbi:LAMI_0E01508g1_1 [Lachancea mirantina]|uniref:LAMI_0E01508g1_1 n=1 Tax=Lachancea mirantina TaxID=1230905 RepID=A0A1G4JIM4_9SACH|nr:LAMI_0E01508g1_1 [Lachancea mirantina]
MIDRCRLLIGRHCHQSRRLHVSLRKADEDKIRDSGLRQDLRKVLSLSKDIHENQKHGSLKELEDETLASSPRTDGAIDHLVRSGDVEFLRNFGVTAVNGRDPVKRPTSGPKQKPWKVSFRMSPKDLTVESIRLENSCVKPPKLSHELERVLFQPMNFHRLQDPRSGVYNFSPWLENIIKVNDFDFSAISGFVTPSKDATMMDLAETHQKKFYSSTSSMTGILSHLHFLFSNFRQINLSQVSKNFPKLSADFTRGAQLPAVVIMKRMKSGRPIFSIDSDKSTDREIILSELGHALEAVLTTDEASFEQLYDKRSEKHSPSENLGQDSYHYSKAGDFILRSQLDAYHPDLPGSGVFDLKTRAVAAVRHDLAFVEHNNNYTGYKLEHMFGKYESFEREFFELLRSTLLKYSLQARIGQMDGIFLAYHNISKIFGFQYLPLEEIDFILHSYGDSSFLKALKNREALFKAIYGDESFVLRHDHSNHERKIASNVADAEFKMSMSLLSTVFKMIQQQMPPKFDVCRIIFKTERVSGRRLRKDAPKKSVLKVIVAPLSSTEVTQFQKGRFSKGETDMVKFLEHSRKNNEKTSHHLFGFEIDVNHSLKHHPSTVIYPKFAGQKSKVLGEAEKTFVRQAISSNYYASASEWRHPHFYHSSDVSDWAIDVEVRSITERSKLKHLYMGYLDDKLDILAEHTAVNQDSAKAQAEILTRIKRCMEGIDERNTQPSNKASTITQLQATLRAYAKKGELNRKL